MTLRVDVPTSINATSQLTTAVAAAGGALTALDVVESHPRHMVVDVTCDAADVAHADSITVAAGFRIHSGVQRNQQGRISA